MLKRGKALAATWLNRARYAWLRATLPPGVPPRSFERVAIVAPLGRRNGIAEGARLQYAALRRRGIEAELIDAAPALRNPFWRAEHRPASLYIVHSGGPETAALLGAVAPAAGRAYRIAYWAWELASPPPSWAGLDALVHEIWTPSRHARDSLRQLFAKPIHVAPHIVEPHARRRRQANEPLTALCMADSRSSISRKNPAGAVAAFRAAFGASPRARLIVKLNGRPDEVDSFARDLAAPNIEVASGYLDEAGMDSLFARADVLLSLHRAEGFGLPMLESMARGIPVIGTGWSGNLEFMSASDSILVPYRLTPVQDAAGVYSGGEWAEPDVDYAAAALVRLCDDPGLWERLSEAAHAAALRAYDAKLPIEAAPARSTAFEASLAKGAA
ncbi:hypothetical protein SLNSH_16340 [Alsobacter soli]|uniref:Uncharacterized protein n=1 Tax=Alsobacter soli TaxID=2109933 RepID=A0A2T1HR58_9HYPH|nr:glycosyltransferase [Alsobacter soli]PSC03999.1 hypothetical protein SLNSH_16340 [Alsobacter soli]